MEDQEFNTHPYYTFCPEWKDVRYERDMGVDDFIKYTNL